MAPSKHAFYGSPAPSPGVWAAALATGLVLIMLAVLLWIVAVNAFGWFWPARVHLLTTTDDQVLIGTIVQRESVPDTQAHRLKLKVGARDIDGRDFTWVDESAITGMESGPELIRLERTEYGDVFGRLQAVRDATGRRIDLGQPGAVDSVLRHGRDLQDRREDLLHQLERVRRPMTDVEDELDIREKSRVASTPETQAVISELEERLGALAIQLGPRLDEIQHLIEDIDADLERGGLEIDTGRGVIVADLGTIVRLTRPNTMSLPVRLWEMLRRGVEFLLTDPREANTEGGIFPALFGTVLLVLLMTIAVVPFGVVTAVYMTEYAREGWLLSLATQAVNNLAGVPSIVFGMFGLGFFIYGVGGSLDRLFFSDRLPTPTLGTGGMLWASLTLALLTLPVVVVASREGLLAVPRDWRDGSRALGATKWQTLRTIILPAAMPGILTGVILAIGRAAGEVAPLMLTGAVKLAPSLALDGTAPFLHLDRKFMHLGFHIYDVSMQSPNVEAAKPMAFATTLVLLALVVGMNLTAILIRRRLQKSYRGGEV